MARRPAARPPAGARGQGIAGFESACGQVEVVGAVRHEERAFASLLAAAAGADVLIVPAGVDPIGEPACYPDEIATQLSATAIAPVLRVRRPVPTCAAC